MNVLQKRIHNDEVLKLLSDLRYKNKPIELVGSASLQSQRYFSDYDFFSVVGKDSTKQSFDEFINIIGKIEANPNYYPVELKIQLKDGKKIKINQPILLDYNEYKEVYSKIDFVKLDLCIFSEFRFIEVSIIYKIYKDAAFTKEVYLQELRQSIKELEDDKSHYKVLKRMFNMYKANGDNENLQKLTAFFNSDVGQRYQIKSNLEAIQLMKETYPKNERVKQKIKINLSKIKPYELRDLTTLQNEVNKSALLIKKSFLN